MHHFDIEIGRSLANGSWGYRLYDCGADYSRYEEWATRYGFKSEDAAHRAACKLLDKEFGKGNWTF